MLSELGLSMIDTYKIVREYLEYKHVKQLLIIRDTIIDFWGLYDPIVSMINDDLRRLCSSNDIVKKDFNKEMYVKKRNGEIIELPISFNIDNFFVELLNYYNY